MTESRASYREGYPESQPIQTRWSDNDVYGHVNNVVYYSYFDSAINRFLIERGVLDLEHGTTLGVCVASQCDYKRSIAYPDAIEVAFRAGKIGRTSVTYELAIFKLGEEGTDAPPVAVGSFVHVFVDRETRKPIPIPDQLRAVLETIKRTDLPQ